MQTDEFPFDRPPGLEQVTLFQGLTCEQLDVVCGLLRRQVFASGATVISEDQLGESAYILLRGSVKVLVRGAEESSVLVAIRGPGEIVGEMSLLDGLGRSATIVAQEETEVLRLERAAFWETLWPMPPVPQNMTRILSSRLRLMTVRAQIFSSLDVRGRVAYQILAFAREYGREVEGGIEIPFRLTQSDLANMVGASRLRVNQVFAYWKRHSHIAVDADQRVIVLDAAALERACA